MSTLFLIEQGAKLKKESKKFVIEKDDNVLLEIPEFKIERVFIFGNIQLTTQAMKFLLENGIETSLFTLYGKFLGRLVPVESKNVPLRIAQYNHYISEEFKLEISKTIITGKIRNAKTILLKYFRNHPEVDFVKHIEELDILLEEIPRKNKISSLLGVEGRASAVYFECFGKMILKDFNFTERIPRHPKDPVNSLLSFGYALLTNELFSSISARGFDPYLGFLHSNEYGRPALALDLMEEFRQPLIDRLVLELINKEVIKSDEFEEKEEGLYLNEKARKNYLMNYERRMQTVIVYNEKTINYREVIHYQVEKFANTLIKKEPYIPFEIK
ncbi:MAG: CRISPR-associated endonuclease Cas1 [bacterium]|nr:CRISPR-associated endonuclease Cas1 [bacterium]